MGICYLELFFFKSQHNLCSVIYNKSQSTWFALLVFLSRKKREMTIRFMYCTQLPAHIPRNALPRSLGGALLVDHAAWLRNCYKSMTNRHDDDLEPLTPAPLAEGADSVAPLTVSYSSHFYFPFCAIYHVILLSIKSLLYFSIFLRLQFSVL
jgi:hypothetical protein